MAVEMKRYKMLKVESIDTTRYIGDILAASEADACAYMRENMGGKGDRFHAIEIPDYHGDRSGFPRAADASA